MADLQLLDAKCDMCGESGLHASRLCSLPGDLVQVGCPIVRGLFHSVSVVVRSGPGR